MKCACLFVVFLLLLFVSTADARHQHRNTRHHRLGLRDVAPPNPPSIGAFDSGVYRNVFVEGGVATEEECATHADDLWNAFLANRFGVINSSLGYIQAENGVKTEGQSYGMMICVQTDHETEFRQLWNFAMTFMYHPTGQYEGYFAWLVQTNGKHMAEGPAPDGESWFVMALLLADARWGSDPDPDSIYNYAAQANSLLHRMLHGNPSNSTMVDSSALEIKFVPESPFTDPSYHLPHFYEYFSLYIEPEEDRPIWAAIAEKSRSLWLKFAYPVSGFAPAYAYFNGTVWNETGQPYDATYASHYSEDAWRTISNAAVDYAWFAADDSAIEYANRMAQFLDQKLSAGVPYVGAYYGELNLDGSNWANTAGTNHSFEDPAAYSLHGVLSLAANASSGVTAWRSLQRLWDTPIPNTYYQQLCNYLSFLHCSGRFQIYKPTTDEDN